MLQNLEHLYLAHSRRLSSLPKEFGDLHNLRVLDLEGTDALTCLPKEIGNLRNLRYLDLSYKSTLTCLPKEIGDLPNLEKMDMSHYFPGKIVNAIPQHVWFRVICRRAKLRTKSFAASGNEDSARIMMKLWPQLLSNSKRVYNDTRWIHNRRRKTTKFRVVIEEADAIYQILKDCRGSFVNIFL